MTSLLNNDGPAIYPTEPGYVVADRQLEAARTGPGDNRPPAVHAEYGSAPQVLADTDVDRIQTTVEQVTAQLERYLRSISAADYSEDGLRRKVQAFADTPAAKAVDAALTAAERVRDKAQADLDKAMRALSPAGDTAQELRNGRAWDRARRILDAAAPGKVTTEAENFLRNADPAERGVLIQEIPAYLKSRGIEFNASMRLIIAQVAPEYADAMQRAADAEKVYILTRENVKAFRGNLARLSNPSGYHRPMLVNARQYDPHKRR